MEKQKNEFNHFTYSTALKGGRNKTEPKYRNDENVRETLSAQHRHISVDIKNTPPKMARSITFIELTICHC